MTTRVSVLAGIPHRVDGLCTTCHLPALWTVNVYTMTETPAPYAVRVVCRDCSQIQEA